jgi:hypothetical protein
MRAGAPYGAAMTRIATVAALLTILAVGPAEAARARTRGTAQKAMWLSIAHPGIGEWYNRNWGSFWENCPPRKFWLGFIPLYGWPGYLQVLSAIDAHAGRTSDNLTPVD